MPSLATTVIVREMQVWPRAIPRGRIYHSLLEDTYSLATSFFAELDNSRDVLRFESEFAAYVGSKGCVSFPLARTGILAVLENLELPPGSKIIMPPLTIKGILDVVLSLNLQPVFVDLDEENACFNVEKLENAILKHRPKAAIVTYLFGIVPNIEGIIKPLKDSGVFVIEDFSQTLNGRFQGKNVGTFGNCGVYSSSSMKTLDTFSGGHIVSDDLALIDDLKSWQNTMYPPNRKVLIRSIIRSLIRNFATQRKVFDSFTFPVIRLVSKIRVSTIIRFAGNRPQEPIQQIPKWWLSRYSSFQAKFGLRQLQKISSLDKKRISNAEKINSSTPQKHLRGDSKSFSVYWQNIILVQDGIEFMDYLRKNRIDSALSSLVLISRLEHYGLLGDTPIAQKFYDNGVYIPCYPFLKDQDLEQIIETLNQFNL